MKFFQIILSMIFLSGCAPDTPVKEPDFILNGSENVYLWCIYSSGKNSNEHPIQIVLDKVSGKVRTQHYTLDIKVGQVQTFIPMTPARAMFIQAQEGVHDTITVWRSIHPFIEGDLSYVWDRNPKWNSAYGYFTYVLDRISLELTYATRATGSKKAEDTFFNCQLFETFEAFSKREDRILKDLEAEAAPKNARHKAIQKAMEKARRI